MKGSFASAGAALVVTLTLTALTAGAGPAEAEAKAKAEPVKTAAPVKGGQAMLEKIHWLGHDCFRVDADKVVYFDPFQLGAGMKKADVVFVSHEHSDHCSPADVAAVTKQGTVVVTTASCAKKLKGEVTVVKPGDKLTVQGMDVEVVPAYNLDPARLKYHPRSAGGVGFVVTFGKTMVYHAGDTDFIPEMKSVKADIAMLPVSGTYVMTAEEAAKAAQAMKPEITIPMHYGTIVGDSRDAERLKKLAAPLRVEILKSEKK